MRCKEEHPTRLQQRLHPRMGRQLQPPPSRAPAGHHQGRHRRKAWHTINKLTGRRTAHSRCPVTANAIASQLLNNGRFPDARWTSREVTSLSRAATADANLSSDFTVEELEAAIKKLKSGKAPGRDNIHPEFVIHQSAKTTAWLCSFFTSCFRRSKLPKTWPRATVVPPWSINGGPSNTTKTRHRRQLSEQ